MTKITLIPVIKAFAEAVDLVRALPFKASEIATFLEAEGIKGSRRATGCPIATYIRAHVEPPMGVWFVVTHGQMKFYFGDTIHTYMLPFAVQYFIDQFDRGLYPNLMEPERGGVETKNAL